MLTELGAAQPHTCRSVLFMHNWRFTHALSHAYCRHYEHEFVRPGPRRRPCRGGPEARARLRAVLAAARRHRPHLAAQALQAAAVAAGALNRAAHLHAARARLSLLVGRGCPAATEVAPQRRAAPSALATQGRRARAWLPGAGRSRPATRAASAALSSASRWLTACSVAACMASRSAASAERLASAAFSASKRATCIGLG